MTTASEPDGAPRIAVLDILRGIAILGILFMNINDMGGSLFATFGDVRRYGWSAADQIAWWLREVFANGTARCMLEMLFGVGMVILTDRAATALGAAAAAPGRVRRIGLKLFGPGAVLRGYYARNFVLFVFGLAHIFILLWPGDILHTYGIAAMVAFLFRRLGPKTLLFLGSIMALMQLFGASYGLYQAQRARIEVPALQARAAAGQKLTPDETKRVKKFVETRAERAKDKADMAKRAAIEDRDRSPATGTLRSWVTSAWSSMLFIWGVADSVGPGVFIEPLFVWEAAGTMLIGAALYKWGVIQGARRRAFYVRMTIAAYAVGLGGRAYEAYAVTRFDDYPSLIYAWSEVTRLATTLGHIGAVNLLVGGVLGAKLLRPFAAAGRTALTIYICQTIICLWVLYPPFALGLYGTQGWAAWMTTALVVNALLLWGANIWVRHFDIAPVEWAWRSIVERRRLPWRKGPKLRDNGLPGAIPAT